MAEVQMFVKVRGTGADGAVPFIQDAARDLRQRLTAAGFSLHCVKVAIVCLGCGNLINPGHGSLCASCALMEAEDSLEEMVMAAVL